MGWKQIRVFKENLKSSGNIQAKRGSFWYRIHIVLAAIIIENVKGEQIQTQNRAGPKANRWTQEQKEKIN